MGNVKQEGTETTSLTLDTSVVVHETAWDCLVEHIHTLHDLSGNHCHQRRLFADKRQGSRIHTILDHTLLTLQSRVS